MNSKRKASGKSVEAELRKRKQQLSEELESPHRTRQKSLIVRELGEVHKKLKAIRPTSKPKTPKPNSATRPEQLKKKKKKLTPNPQKKSSSVYVSGQAGSPGLGKRR